MSNQRVRVTVEFDIDTERCRLYGVTPRGSISITSS